MGTCHVKLLLLPRMLRIVRWFTRTATRDVCCSLVFDRLFAAQMKQLGSVNVFVHEGAAVLDLRDRAMVRTSVKGRHSSSSVLELSGAVLDHAVRDGFALSAQPM